MARLRVNLDKSFIYPIGDIVNSASLAEVVGCKVGTLPNKYLGLPLGTKHNSLSVWDGIEEKFRHRLAAWKRGYISRGETHSYQKYSGEYSYVYVFPL